MSDDRWPIVGCLPYSALPTVAGEAAGRFDDNYGRLLRFTAVTDGRRCSVHALDDLIAVGSLRWLIEENDPDAGMIGYVYVEEGCRRLGIATALLRLAEAYAEHYGLPMPRHSHHRTPLGDAWARADGAEPARVIEGQDPLAELF